MEDDDLPVAPPPTGDPCPRCLVPAPTSAARCPNCGQPLSAIRRMAPIMAGVAGILVLIFLFVAVYRVVYMPDQDQTPVVDDQAAPDGQFAPPPETSSGHETPAQPPADSTPPAPPEVPKKPPLDR
jgi:hypothetical protein